MPSLFEKIKSIKQWEKDLVIGYNKQAEKLIYPNQIPVAISYLCLVYHHQYDYFNSIWNTDKIKPKIKINDEKDEFAYISPESLSGTVHGLLDIHKGYIYSWKFQFVGTTNTPRWNDWITVGITNSINHKDNDFSIQYKSDTEPHSYYAYVSIGQKAQRGAVDHGYGFGFSGNDVIEMIVDTKQHIMRFTVNGKDQGIAFDNIDFDKTKYKMAVYNGNKNIKVKLIEFQQDYSTNK